MPSGSYALIILWDAEKGEPLSGRAGEGEQAQTATPRIQQPLTTHLCPRNFLSSCPVSTLHIRTLQSPLPPPPKHTAPGGNQRECPLQEAASEPSAEKLTPLTRELWPSSFLSSLPVPTSHSRTVQSYDPLTSRVGFAGLKLTQLTSRLPFSQMSVLLVLLYASPPLNLRLSPGERKKKAWLTCGPRASSGARPFLGPTA